MKMLSSIFSGKFSVITMVLAGALLIANPASSQGQGPFAPPPSGSTQPQDSGDFLPPGPTFGDDTSFDFEKPQDELEEEIRKEAFDAAIDGLLPLRPEEIRKLLEKFDRTQESVSVPIYPNPKPEVTVQEIPLDPGSKTVAVKVAYGHVTTVNFLDTTGARWPIEDITWAGDFDIIETPGDELAHVIRITPQSEFAFGNMSLKLLTLQTPLVLILETSRDIVHYRFDAVIPEYGPFSNQPIITTAGPSLTAGNRDLTRILEGVIPPNAERLSVTGVDSRTSAYELGGSTVLRTPLTLLSPAWNSSVSSADGTHVYSFPETPVVLLSSDGKTLRARISTRGDILDE